MKDLDNIIRHLNRLKELNSMAMKSDEEIQESKHLVDELSKLLVNVGIKDLKELDQIAYEPIPKQTEEEIKPTYHPQPEEHDTTKIHSMQLFELERQKKDLNNLLQIAKTQEEVDALKQKLAEINKEQNFITTKPDQDGMIHIREEVYRRKLAVLEDQLEHTQGWWPRFRLKSQINKIRGLKGSIQTRNTVIKVARTAGKISGYAGQISNELGRMGDTYSGTKRKTNNKHKKKGEQDDREREPTQDFGFNTATVFGKKNKDKQDQSYGYNLNSMFGGQKPKEEGKKRKHKKRRKHKPKTTKATNYDFDYERTFG